MPSLRSYRRVRYNLGPSPLRNTRLGRVIRSPLFRRASYLASAAQAAGIARRVYRNYKRKRAASSYVEQPFTKKAKSKPAVGASSKVRWNVAKTLRKIPKTKSVKAKIPKSVINSYKEYGLLTAKKMMYISHQHFGSADKFWSGIAHGLTKLVLSYARVYPAKNLQAPCIGPRTNISTLGEQWDNKLGGGAISFGFVTEVGSSGDTTRSRVDILYEDASSSPDVYRSFAAIAQDVETMLKNKYNDGSANPTWLQEAMLLGPNATGNYEINALPTYIQNLDDAEIHLYCNAVVKLQNVTTADHGGVNDHDANAIDANPLLGRVYQAKGHHPHVDGDITQMTYAGQNDNDLDQYFAQTDITGFTLHGHQTLPLSWASGAADNLLGYLQHIPGARALYGNQTVKAGSIYIKPGQGKTLKTSFTFKKTFRQLAHMGDGVGYNQNVGMHTLIGLKMEHRHGEDDLRVGYNRDLDVGCYIKHTRNVYPLKMAHTVSKDQTVDPFLVPVDHAE